MYNADYYDGNFPMSIEFSSLLIYYYNLVVELQHSPLQTSSAENEFWTDKSEDAYTVEVKCVDN